MKFWDDWRGSLSGKPTMLIKNILNYNGYSVDLHKFISTDDKDCFHTHPSTCVRVVLWGGYIEETESGESNVWTPFMFGVVPANLSHRISSTLFKSSYSLWISSPKTAEIELRGSGWDKIIKK